MQAAKISDFGAMGKPVVVPQFSQIVQGLPVSLGNPEKRERPRSRAFPCPQMGCAKLLLVIEAHSGWDRLNLCGRLQYRRQLSLPQGIEILSLNQWAKNLVCLNLAGSHSTVRLT